MNLTVLPERLAVVRLPASSVDLAREMLPLVLDEPLGMMAKTRDEISMVVKEERLPAAAGEEVKTEGGWAAIKVEGPLDFGMVGVMAKLVMPLKEVQVSVFVFSTFDTDYVLVKREKLEIAVDALVAAGFVVNELGSTS